MSENFNKLQENITKKARVNFDCKFYKLIKCKPSLYDDSYHSKTLADLLVYFGQTFSLMEMYPTFSCDRLKTSEYIPITGNF